MGTTFVLFLGVTMIVVGAALLLAERKRPGSVVALFERVRAAIARK